MFTQLPGHVTHRTGDYNGVLLLLSSSTHDSSFCCRGDSPRQLLLIDSFKNMPMNLQKLKVLFFCESELGLCCPTVCPDPLRSSECACLTAACTPCV